MSAEEIGENEMFLFKRHFFPRKTHPHDENALNAHHLYPPTSFFEFQLIADRHVARWGPCTKHKCPTSRDKLSLNIWGAVEGDKNI